jgi:hypothetical protein
VQKLVAKEVGGDEHAKGNAASHAVHPTAPHTRPMAFSADFA